MEKPVKPVMVAREEFAQRLADLCNDSGLPPVILQPLLERAAAEMSRLAQEQYAQEMAAYRKALQDYAEAQKQEQTAEEG